MTMKLNKIFFHLCLLGGLGVLPVQAIAQTVVRPRIQTSALPEETAVYTAPGKKNAGAGNTMKKGKTIAEKSDETLVQGKKRNKKSASKTGVDRRYHALKTNLAYDAVGVLNLAYEVQVHSRMTLDIPVMWSLWDAQRDHALRIAGIQPELRWWIGDETGTGHFFGIHTHVAWYNLKWNDRRYQDTGRPLLGAGLSYGYKLPLSEHWGVSFAIGLGYVNMKYDTYYNIENGAQIDTRIRNYWGPTRVDISLVYRF